MVRLRHRYLVTEYSVMDGKTPAAADVPAIKSAFLMEAINSAIRHLHGVQGVALVKAGLLVKYINNSTSILFIRMRRSSYHIVTSALPFVRHVDGRNITLRTLYTGATIRHCNLFLIKYQRRKLEEQYGCLKSELQRGLFEQELANVKPLSIPSPK